MTAADKQEQPAGQPGTDERSELDARIRQCIRQYRDRGVHLVQVPVPAAGPVAHSYWAKAWYENIRTIVRDAGKDTSLADSAEESARRGEVIHLACTHVSMLSVQGIVAGEECSGGCCEACVFWPPADEEKLEELAQCAADTRLSPEKLLAGRVPKKLARLLDSQGNALLPSFTEMGFYCTCQDGLAGRLCTHTLALLVVLASVLNTQPEVLFALRGLEAGSFDLDETTDFSAVLMMLHDTGNGWECIGTPHADPAPALAAVTRQTVLLRAAGTGYVAVTANQYLRMLTRMVAAYACSITPDEVDAAEHAEQQRKDLLLLELLEDLVAGRKRRKDLPRLMDDLLLNIAGAPQAPGERARFREKMEQKKPPEYWQGVRACKCRDIRRLLDEDDFGSADEVVRMYWEVLLCDARDEEELERLQQQRFSQKLAKLLQPMLWDLAQHRKGEADIPRMAEDFLLGLLDAPADPKPRAEFLRTLKEGDGHVEWECAFASAVTLLRAALSQGLSTTGELFRHLLKEQNAREEEAQQAREGDNAPAGDAQKDFRQEDSRGLALQQRCTQKMNDLARPLLADLAQKRKVAMTIPLMAEDFLLDLAGASQSPKARAHLLRTLRAGSDEEEWDRAYAVAVAMLCTALPPGSYPTDSLFSLLLEAQPELDDDEPDDDEPGDEDDQQVPRATALQQKMDDRTQSMLADLAEGRKGPEDIPQMAENLLLDLAGAPQDPDLRADILRSLREEGGLEEWDKVYAEFVAMLHEAVPPGLPRPYAQAPAGGAARQ